MRSTGLEEAQAGIKIAGRNIRNLRYEDDSTTLRAESEEEVKNFLMRLKEESEKAGLKLSLQKSKIMASSPITSWQISQLSLLVMSNSLGPHGLQPTRLLQPWDFPRKNTGEGCHFLLQEVFLTQGLNPGLLHCRQILYPLSHHGSPCT